VIDDGSTDNTREVVGKYKDLTYIHKPNEGQASALNLGLEKTKGEIVSVLDADDYWCPHKLERVVDKFREDDEIGMVHHRVDVVNEHGEKYYNFPFRESLDEGRILDKAVNLKIKSVPMSGLSFRRKTLEKIMPIPKLQFRSCPDSYLLTQIPLIAKVGAVHETLSYFVVHGQNHHLGAGLSQALSHLSSMIGVYDSMINKTKELGIKAVPPPLEDIRDYILRAMIVEKYQGHYMKFLKLYLKLIKSVFRDESSGFRQKLRRSLIDSASIILSPMMLYRLKAWVG
jgi:glycosyltransferase involved in cell wall biosynthesis